MPQAAIALAPVVAKGIGSLISHKQKGAAEKQQQEYAKAQAAQADAEARAKWEEQQNSPQAQAMRFKQKFALGKLAGAMGGLAKVPQSIKNYYMSSYAMPTYSGTSSWIEPPKKGGTGWDIAGGVADALQYLDTSKLKGNPKTGGFSGFGAGSSFGPGAALPQPSTDLTGAGNIKRNALQFVDPITGKPIG